MLPVEAMKCSANTIVGINRQYERHTGKLWDRNKCVAKHFSVIRREEKMKPLMELMCVWQRSRLKKGDFVGFAVTQAVKVFSMSKARAASQRHTVHDHRKITAILDATFACFHKDMDELIHAHPPREAEPECIVIWFGCLKLILEQGEPHDCGRSILATKYS